MGLSVLRVRRKQFRGELDVVSGDWRNRRVHLLSGLAVNQDRTDGYQDVLGWGPTPHETGDEDYLVGTGPAAGQVFNLSSDGLGNKIIGTGFNCSGGTTPWGTVLSAEENFQGSVGTVPLDDPNVGKINLVDLVLHRRPGRSEARWDAARATSGNDRRRVRPGRREVRLAGGDRPAPSRLPGQETHRARPLPPREHRHPR